MLFVHVQAGSQAVFVIIRLATVNNNNYVFKAASFYTPELRISMPNYTNGNQIKFYCSKSFDIQAEPYIAITLITVKI